MIKRSPDKDNKVTLKRDEKIPSPFLTRPEAAAYLKMKPESLSNLHSMGKGPTYYRKMGRVYYLEQDLIDWILSGKIEPGKTCSRETMEEAHDADRRINH